MTPRRRPIVRAVAGCVLLALAALGGTLSGTALQHPDLNEVWVNPGIEAPAPTDPSTFMAEVTVAFVGTFERASPRFLGAEDPRLATRLVFRPVEFLKGSAGINDTVEVWTLGGTYLETSAGRKPHGLAEVAERLEVGASYFVAARRLTYPPDAADALWLAERGTLVQLDGERVRPAVPISRWPREVIDRERNASPTLGGSVSERTAFLAALRRAAGQ